MQTFVNRSGQREGERVLLRCWFLPKHFQELNFQLQQGTAQQKPANAAGKKW